MAQAGDVIENPKTGERIVFLQVSQDTNGDLLQMEYIAKPHLLGPPGHIHIAAEERFEILAGTGVFRVAGKEIVLGAGQLAVIPPGTPHAFANPGDEELRMRLELRPALHMETFFETNFGLGRDGKTNVRGRSNLLQDAIVGREFGVFLAGPPIFLQRPLIVVLAAIAKLLGYRSRYEKYSGPE